MDTRRPAERIRHPKPLAALTLAAGAGVIAASLQLPSSAAAGTARALPARARAAVQADLAAVTPVAAPVIKRVAPLLWFDDDVAACPPPAASCAYPASDITGPWRIHLDAQTTAFTYPSNRFVVYHEIGHAVWELVLGAAGRNAFTDAVRRALNGKPCVNDQGRPCGPITEMFADEFARFAGGFAVSMSYYCTPPLVPSITMASLVGAPAARNAAKVEYLRRPVYDRGKIRLTRIRADAANVREDRGIRR